MAVFSNINRTANNIALSFKTGNKIVLAVRGGIIKVYGDYFITDFGGAVPGTVQGDQCFFP